MSLLNVYLLQWDVVWESAHENFRAVRRLLARSPVTAEGLVVLPEMFATGFSPHPRNAESPGGPVGQFVSQVAGELGVYVLAGILETERGAYWNRAVLVSPDGERVWAYNKMNLFTPAKENAFCTAGKTPIVFEIDGFRLSVFICYDLRFPEIFRVVAKDVDGMILIASWPRARSHHWRSLLMARAIENQCFVVGVNRIGEGGGVLYDGQTMIIDPNGTVLDCLDDREAVGTVSLNSETVTTARDQLPALRDAWFL